jgi:hypothetical protein
VPTTPTTVNETGSFADFTIPDTVAPKPVIYEV